MSTAPEKVTTLARRPKAGALVNAELIQWTKDQVDLIQRTVAKGTSEDEFKLFLYQSARTGLDPLAKQIYAVMRWSSTASRNVMAIQTGIDGYRLIADRTRKYAGSDDAVFTGEALNPGMNDSAAQKASAVATVTVYKIVQGVRCPFTASARWREYYPGEKQGRMWRDKPHVMLAKVAEALALRKAFPADLSGVYTAEEMEQAGPIIEAELVGTEPPKDGPAPEPAREAAGTTKKAAGRKPKAAPEPAPETPAAPPAAAAPAAHPEDETPEQKGVRLGIAQAFARDKYADFDAKKIGDAERGLIFGTAKSYGFKGSAELHPITERLFGVSSVKEVPLSGIDDMIRAITGEPIPEEAR